MNASRSHLARLPDRPSHLPVRRGHPDPFGTRARVALAQGDVEGGLALVGMDRRAGTAIYALRIANQSASPLRAHMTCARPRELPVLAYPLDVHVAPFSIAETLLPVRLAEVGPYDRAIVKVSGADIAFTLEAPAPPRANTRKRWLKIAVVVVVAILGAAFGAAVATPRIDLLAAPARAFAGAPLDIPYAFAGLGSMQYTLQTKDGRQLAAGLLTDRQGTLHFVLPRNSGSQLVLAATLASPLGTARALRRVAIAQAPSAAKPIAAAPRIESFTVASPSVVAGAPLVVHYSTNAKSGQVWLIDETGRLWASASLFADGTSTLKVPQAAAGQKMRVVLHARNGSADTVSSLGVTVQPGDVVASTAAVTPSNAPLALVLSASSVAPGEDVTVTLKGNHGDSRISLTDAAGNTVEQGDVPAGQDAVTLSAPSVKTATTYYVVASISSGISEQSLVQKLVVTPR
jgi:hypothetical protein